MDLSTLALSSSSLPVSHSFGKSCYEQPETASKETISIALVWQRYPEFQISLEFHGHPWHLHIIPKNSDMQDWGACRLIATTCLFFLAVHILQWWIFLWPPCTAVLSVCPCLLFLHPPDLQPGSVSPQEMHECMVCACCISHVPNCFSR